MELEISHQSPIPLHSQIEKVLRKLIKQEPYKKGKPLPKEVEMANRFGVSRNTIRQATNKLETEGLIIRKKGVGTFVTNRSLSTQLASWHSFTMEMLQKGVPFKNVETKLVKVKSNEKLSNFFRVNEGQKLFLLKRIRSIENESAVYFESYFHPRIQFREDTDFGVPLYDIIENEFNIVVVRSNEHIRAQLAGEMSKKLCIGPKDPILVRERFVFDVGDRPIEYALCYYRADKFTYSIDIRKEEGY